MEEMGISDKVKLITMPFPPRIFYREYLKASRPFTAQHLDCVDAMP